MVKTEITPRDELPQQWKLAHKRDSAGGNDFELSGVLLFVLNMALTLKQPLLAWLEPEGVTANLPVYWYVTSFPKTRPILLRAGLKTLANARTVPHSLRLDKVVAAEGSDLEKVMQALRDFFRQRQPRRVGH